jgi:hypothetical protein
VVSLQIGEGTQLLFVSITYLYVLYVHTSMYCMYFEVEKSLLFRPFLAAKSLSHYILHISPTGSIICE